MRDMIVIRQSNTDAANLSSLIERLIHLEKEKCLKYSF